MYVTGTAPKTRDITWTLIAAAYHSDGKTHGAIPGEFGKTTHFQLHHLMYPKPFRTFDEWRGATAAPVTAPPEKKQPGFGGVFAIAGLIAVAFLLRRRYE